MQPEPDLPEVQDWFDDAGYGDLVGRAHRVTRPHYLSDMAFYPDPKAGDYDVDPTWQLIVVMDDGQWGEMSNYEGEGWYAIVALEPCQPTVAGGALDA